MFNSMKVFASLAAALLLAALPPAPAHAQAAWYGGQFKQCSDLPTVGVVDCVSNLTRNWDARLNAAYKRAMAGLSAGRATKLRAAQRLWIKYRDANCGFYAVGQGTIARIETAECLRIMTANRAVELERMPHP